MLSVSFVRWLFGYVTFIVLNPSGREGSAERFLNLAARMGINLWKINKKDGVFSAAVRAAQYWDLRGPARKAGIRLRVKARRGLPFFLKKCSHRKGLFAGGAVFFLILMVMPMYVWSVNISGNSAIPEGEIRAAASELGLEPGALKSRIQPLDLQQKLMLKFPDISWLTVNTHGCVVTIELEEKVKLPEIIQEDQYCNIKAARSGQVISIDATVGQAQVNPGDAVAEGQLLISGVLEDSFGGTQFLGSIGALTLILSSQGSTGGKVIAETDRILRVEVPLKKTVEKPTGDVVVRRSLKLFGVQLPLSFSGIPDGEYRREVSSSPLTSGGTILPISIFTETWTEITREEVVLTEEEAAKEAEEKMKELMEKEMKDVKVLSTQKKGGISGEAYQLTVDCECEEDIAIESEILVK